MKFSFSNWLIQKFSHYLLKTSQESRGYLCDFNHILETVRQCDVLLIEGRSRVSEIIQAITYSPWTHAALYLGHPDEIENPEFREIAKRHAERFQTSQLLIESDIGLGTVISPIEKYKNDHIRLLRPMGLKMFDAQKVIDAAMGRLGTHYNIRHILDLFRFFLPWRLFPRRWRSSLFQSTALKPTREICSSMIAGAFSAVNFPILPNHNPRLFTPSDFDYSPYFAVIKYPITPTTNSSAIS